MTPSLRKFTLTTHVTFSVGWLGAVVAYLALALAGLTSKDAQTLQRPMATLRSTCRVRSVGQRHLTRYYPALVRAAGGKD